MTDGARGGDGGWRRTWPSDRLYWALLDPRALGRTRLADDELPNLLESWLPLPLESVHATFARMADGRVVACAVDRDALTDDVRAGVLSLVPDALPSELPDDVRDEVGVERLELLHGAFEPVAIGHAKARRRLSLAAIAALMALVAGFGFVRHARAIGDASDAVESRRQQLISAAFADRGASKLPVEMRLVAELRELRGTRATGVSVPFDASDALAQLLTLWPEGVEIKPEGIAVTQRSVSVRGSAKGADETQRLADALSSLKGWRAEPPQFRAARDGVTFTVSLVPDDSAGDKR